MLPLEGCMSSPAIAYYPWLGNLAKASSIWNKNDVLFQFTVDPEQHRFELMGSFILQIFFLNKYLYCFLSQIGSPQLQRAYHVCWSMHFTWGTWALTGFGMGVGVLTSTSVDTEGQLSFYEVWLHRMSAQSPCCLRVNCIFLQSQQTFIISSTAIYMYTVNFTSCLGICIFFIGTLVKVLNIGPFKSLAQLIRRDILMNVF